MKRIEIADTRDAAVCPKCRKRNTCELDAPQDDMGDITWQWECHDCGIEYTVYFEVEKVVYDEEDGPPPKVEETYRTLCANCNAILFHNGTCSCGCKVTKVFRRSGGNWVEVR
jgi:hypothetical protein